jgi:hypothetical protein
MDYYSVINRSTLPQHVKHRFTKEPNNSTPSHIPKMDENIFPHKGVCINIHSSIFFLGIGGFITELKQTLKREYSFIGSSWWALY